MAVEFAEQSGLVNRVVAEASYFSSSFSESIGRFSLANLLTQHGSPSRVYVGIEPPVEQNAPWLYDLVLFYDSQGFAIFYMGRGISRSNNALEVCPTFDQLTLLKLYIQLPTNGLALESAIGEGFPGYLQPLSVRSQRILHKRV